MNASDFFINQRDRKSASEPQGLTASILCSLHETISAYGLPGEGGKTRYLRSQEPDIGVSIAASGNGRTMIIIRDGVSNGGSFFINLKPIPNDNHAFVIWDKRVRVEEIETFINNSQKILEGMILTHLLGEERRLRVDTIFANKGAAYLIPPSEDPKKMLAEFDRPEELVIVRQGPVLCLVKKSELSLHKERGDAALSVLKEAGLDLNNLHKLSPEEIMALRAKIDVKLSKK